MPRDINSTVVTALESGGFKPFYAVFLDFMNGDTSTATPLYLWTGTGDLVSGGNTYQGTGALMRIDHLEESATLKANGITLTFKTSIIDSIGYFLITSMLGRRMSLGW